MNNAAAATPLSLPVALTTNAAAAAPCGDYHPNNAVVTHVNFKPLWWDNTTTPLPWAQPYIPPAPIQPWTNTPGSITVNGGSYPTQEQKAELVLAVLLNVLMGKSYVELMNRLVPDGELERIEFVYQETGLLIRVPKAMRFREIVNALYEEFGNLRGKEVR